MNEKCAICGCKVHRDGNYAKPTPEGRSHATFHHYVAKRFFRRSANRRGTLQKPVVFSQCPWNLERDGDIYCYECHEMLLHNPVFTKKDIEDLCKIVKKRGLNERVKPRNMKKLAERIKLLHEVIAAGLEVVRQRKGAAAVAGRRP